MKFRHELKYVVSSAQVEMIKNRVEHLLPRDPHAGEKGMYAIRSLYFDDYENRCYRENDKATKQIYKYRNTIYKQYAHKIKMECKRKERGMTHKESCPLTQTQTRMLMEGRALPDIASQPPVLRKLTMQMLIRRMRPVVIVEYERIPYVYELGNVRITLDLNVSSGKDVGAFLEESISKRPVMPAGRQLLEVKYDEYLPDFIYNNLQLENLQQTAFSKYYLCRKYTR